MEIQLTMPLLLLILYLVLNTARNESKYARLLPLYLPFHQQMELNVYRKLVNEPELTTSPIRTLWSQLVCTAGLVRESLSEKSSIVVQRCVHYLGVMQSLNNGLASRMRRDLQISRPSLFKDLLCLSQTP
jgi:hypothetical protein